MWVHPQTIHEWDSNARIVVLFGVLHTKIHEIWARGTGTQLRDAESGFRYTSTTTFVTFPFPWKPGAEPSTWQQNPDFLKKSGFSPAAAFEFSTYGDSLWDSIRSLRTSIFENQVFRHGGSDAAKAWVAQEYGELFMPAEEAWLEKAIADAREAFNGILSNSGYFTKI